MPERHQLCRKKGYRKPEGSVVVTRASKRLGNPFKIGDRLPEEYGGLLIANAEIAVRLYRTAVQNLLDGVRHAGEYNPLWDRWTPEAFRDALYDLRGRDVCCTCKVTDTCHGDVLMEAAASLPERVINGPAAMWASLAAHHAPRSSDARLLEEIRQDEERMNREQV